MKKFIILLLILFPLCAFSQISTGDSKGASRFGINFGINNSKFNKDTIDYKYASKLLVGAYWKYNFSEKVSCKNSLNYSLKGSTKDNPFKKYELHTIELNLMPQIRISEAFYIHTGMSFTGLLLPFEVVTNSQTAIGYSRELVDGFNSEINLLIGMELKLLENVNLAFNYIIPTFEGNTNNFQVTASINLTKRNPKINYNEIKRNKSHEQIKELYSGVLLVRLHDSNKVISEMLRVGETEKAKQLKQFNEAYNKAICDAFRNNFDFCEVQFFYSSDSELIKNKQNSQIFLNDSLIRDTSIIVESSRDIFIAEFCTLENDTVEYYSHTSYDQPSAEGVKKTYNYYTASDFDIYGLVVKDHNFVQLNYPFPFFIKDASISLSEDFRPMIFLPKKFTKRHGKSVRSTVTELNINLHDFYNGETNSGF